jgi:hypothetical protein
MILDTEKTVLHFNFSHLPADTELTFVDAKKQVKVQEHTPETRQLHRNQNRLLAHLSDEQLDQFSHFVEGAEFSSTEVSTAFITYPSKRAGAVAGAIAGVYVHKPRQAVRRAVEDLMLHTNEISMPLRMKRYMPNGLLHHHENLDRAQLLHLAVEYHEHAGYTIDCSDMAVKLVMQHPDIASTMPDSYYKIQTIIENDIHFLDLVRYLEDHNDDDDEYSWYENTVTKDYDGKIMEPCAELIDSEGEVIVWPTQMIDGKEVSVIPQYNLKDGLAKAIKPIVSSVLNTIKDTHWLKGRNWNASNGTTVRTREGNGEVLVTGYDGKASTGKWSIHAHSSQYGVDLYHDTITFKEDTQELYFEMKNWANRWLGVYCQFLDVNGNVIDGEAMDPRIGHLIQPSSSKKFIELIGPCSIIFGGPVAALTPRAKLSIKIPKNAASANIMLGGLGDGSIDMDVDRLGIIMTSVVSYGMPCLLSLMSVGLQSTQWYVKFFDNPENVKVLMGIGVLTYVSLFQHAGNKIGYGPVLAKTADFIGGIIFSAVMKQLAIKVTKQVTMQQMMQNAPAVGWALRIASLASAVGAMVSTTYAVSASPSTFYYEAKRSMDLDVTVHPDPTHGTSTQAPIWPETGNTYKMIMQYGKGTITNLYEGPLPAKRDQPIHALFSQATGNAVKVAPDEKFQLITTIYAKNDTVVGQWISDWRQLAPDGDENKRTEVGSIVELLIPLLPTTQYSHRKKLAYNAGAGKYEWNSSASAPKATLDDLNKQNVSELVGITINNLAYKLGYAYRADQQNLPLDKGDRPVSTGMYLMKTISTLNNPSAGMKFSDKGMSVQPSIAFDQFGPAGLLTLDPATEYMNDLNKNVLSNAVKARFKAKEVKLEDSYKVEVVVKDASWTIKDDKNKALYSLRRQVDVIKVFTYPTPEFSPNNFYLDTTAYATTGKYHLRLVELKDSGLPNFNDSNKSWGTFDINVSAMVIHPGGYALGVSYDQHQLNILQLPAEGVSDDQAPASIPFGGKGWREGLLAGPVAMTVTSDGRILILESQNSRIQSFDTSGNPVPCFATPFSFQVDSKFGGELTAKEFSLDFWKALQKNITVYNNEDKLHVQRYLNMPQITIPEVNKTDLNKGVINGVLRKAFTVIGTTLSDAATVTTNEADSSWIIQDPQLGMFDVRLGQESKKNEINVYRMMSVSVEEKARGARWTVNEVTNNLRFDVAKTADNKLKFTRLSSTMALKNPVSDNVKFLDVACEMKGFIYVLWHKKHVTSAADYYLDIYNPDGSPLTKEGSNGQPAAARMTVDQWRNMFTLNYEQMLGKDGRPEPTVSVWIPST